MFSHDAEAAAVAYLKSLWPEEGCGIIEAGAFVPIKNMAHGRRERFSMPRDTFSAHKVEAVVHSHCSDRHPFYPSAADMRGQMASAVPWGLVWTGEESASDILWWGDFRLDDELLEREFIPGIHDCYSLLRSYMWQERRIKLPEIPREDKWWGLGLDLFMDGYEAAGAVAVGGPYLPGDAVLMAILSNGIANHVAIVLEDGLILHHLAGRLSRREPLGPWAGHIVKHLRYGA